MANCEKIVIAGFSGAGKSGLLREISLSRPQDFVFFDDLDQLILRKWGTTTLADLIAQKGWEWFRQTERTELFEWINQQGKGVLALGGGTLSPKLWDELQGRPELKVVYVEADVETCWQRLTTFPGEERPLLKEGKEAFLKRFQERSLVFEKIPLRLKNSEGRSLSELAQEFWEQVHC